MEGRLSLARKNTEEDEDAECEEWSPVELSLAKEEKDGVEEDMERGRGLEISLAAV